MDESKHVAVFMWRSGENLQESVLSFHSVGPGVKPRSPGLSVSALYIPRHLTGPVFYFTDRASYSLTGQTQIHFVANLDVIFLPGPPEFWDSRHAPPCPASVY